MKTFSVNVPAGIRNGEKIRLLGQGKEGINGGKNGDFFIKIKCLIAASLCLLPTKKVSTPDFITFLRHYMERIENQ